MLNQLYSYLKLIPAWHSSFPACFDAFLHTLQLTVITMNVPRVEKLNVRNLIGVVLGKETNVLINQVALPINIIFKWSCLVTTKISHSFFKQEGKDVAGKRSGYVNHISTS